MTLSFFSLVYFFTYITNESQRSRVRNVRVSMAAQIYNNTNDASNAHQRYAFRELAEEGQPVIHVLSHDDVRCLADVSWSVFQILRMEIRKQEIACHPVQYHCTEPWYVGNVKTIIDHLSMGGLLHAAEYTLRLPRSRSETIVAMCTILRALAASFELYTRFADASEYYTMDTPGVLKAYAEHPPELDALGLPAMAKWYRNETIAAVELVLTHLLEKMWCCDTASRGCCERSDREADHSCTSTNFDEAWLRKARNRIDLRKVQSVAQDVLCERKQFIQLDKTLGYVTRAVVYAMMLSRSVYEHASKERVLDIDSVWLTSLYNLA